MVEQVHGRRSALVTGAAGFLGRHLTETLSRQGWHVIAFCLPTDEVACLVPLADVVLGDITDARAVHAAMPDGLDAVFHVASDTSTWSRHATRQQTVNVVGTTNVIEAALRHSARRLIYTSSISAYGYQPGVRIEEDTPSNVMTRGDHYGRTKLLAEARIRQAASDRGLSAAILSPVNILGPYDRSNWSQQLILPIARGTLRAVPPGVATWAYVGDVVSAHLAAVDRGGPLDSYVLGGVEASFQAVINGIEHILGRPLSQRTVPKAALRLALWAALAKSRLDGQEPLLTPQRYRRAVGRLLCNDAKARRELGYARTELHTMLSETIDWLRREQLLEHHATAHGDR